MSGARLHPELAAVARLLKVDEAVQEAADAELAKRALHAVGGAELFLEVIRDMFPDDHPNAADELAGAFQELKNIRAWLEG